MAVFYVDGQSIGNEQRTQPRIAKIAFLVQSSDSGQPDPQNSKVFFKDIGDKTNNEAEYHALLAALSYITRDIARKGSDVKNTRICSDSKVLVNQVNGDWKVEQARLVQLREKAAKIMADMSLRRLVWIPREQNFAGLWFEGKWKARGEPITWSYY
jgi:ribonuclease HI